MSESIEKQPLEQLALSISFKYAGEATPSPTPLETELRGGALKINGAQKFIEALNPSQKDLAHQAIGFATGDPFFLLFKTADEHGMGVLYTHANTSQLDINSNEDFIYQIKISLGTPEKQGIDGLLQVKGKLKDDKKIDAIVTLSFIYTNNAEKVKIEKILAQIAKLLYANTKDSLSVSNSPPPLNFKKIKSNLAFKLLPITVLLYAAIVTPTFILFLIPFLSATALPPVAIGLIGASIALAGLYVSFQITAGIFLFLAERYLWYPEIKSSSIVLPAQGKSTPASEEQEAAARARTGSDPIMRMSAKWISSNQTTLKANEPTAAPQIDPSPADNREDQFSGESDDNPKPSDGTPQEQSSPTRSSSM